jgi:hypothetical protein
MNERTLLASASPITQSIDAVKSLLAYVGRSSDPLPTFVEMPGSEVLLVLSGKKDAYYTTTAQACSCPSGIYRPGQICKHRRTYFLGDTKAAKIAEAKAKTEESRQQARDYQARQRALTAKAKSNPGFGEENTTKRLARPPKDNIRPEGKWPEGFNGPVDPDMIKAESPKSSILREMLIDCGHDTTLRDVTYWAKKHGQEA